MANRITYDKFGNMMVDGASLSVKNNSYKVSESFKQAIRNIELELKRAAISEEEYYKTIEKLRDTYLEKGTKEWWSYTNKIISYDEKVLKEQKKMIEEVYSDISSHVYKTQNELLKAQESFSEKLSEHAELYKTVKQTFKGVGENGEDITSYKLELGDLDGEKAALSEYLNLLLAVKKRGEENFSSDGFKEFFDMLRDMPIDDAVRFSKTLLKEDEEGFVDFVDDFKDISYLNDRISKLVFSDDVKKAEDAAIQHMKESLENAGLEIPEGFFLSGSLSAEKFGEGFVAEIESVVSDISKRFSDLMPKNDILLKAYEREAEKGNVFAPVYNLYGSGETISEKLHAAKSQALIDKLRGGY